MSIDTEEHYDFSSLVFQARPGLLVTLAETHSALANLHIRIAFLKQEEIRDPKLSKEQRIAYEALRDAYIEKKWLVVKLLEERVLDE